MKISKMSLTATVIGGAVLAGGCLTNEQKAAAQNAASSVTLKAAPAAGETLTGKDAMRGYVANIPGVRRKIAVNDLPAPFATPSVDNGAHVVSRPDGALPLAPEGFTVTQFATGLNNPRKIVTAPNGDIFIAESQPGQIRILRDTDGDGKPDVNEIYATGLTLPFGIAFYPSGANPKYVYVGNTDGVVRFPYKSGDVKASGPSELVTDQISGGGRLRGGGHWTRDVVFSKDNKTMYVSVGSLSNVDENDNPIENERARIWQFTPEGKDRKAFATGIRNPVGLAIDPSTGDVWTSVNERDGLGDNLVPDYVTRVTPGAFYGWPWYYMGSNQDPRQKGKRPDLMGKVTVPDVLVEPHMASLAMTFYTGKQFPKDYSGDAFASEHGSWNRSLRSGYKVIRIPVTKGRSDGSYIDFLTGFVTPGGDVWGRPVGVTVAKDGSVLVTDDGSNSVWRVTYTGKSKTASR